MARSHSPEELLGVVLGGRYRVGEVLGRGGMGTVHAATQIDLGRAVALKVLSNVDAAGFERLRIEARAAASLGHPNIVQVSDFQHNAGEPPFLVMERLSGESLGALVAREGALDVARVAGIAAQTLSALVAAHAAGIVHRDIKPDNIFLTQASPVHPDLVKLLDFGVAKSLGDAPASALTVRGAIIGTPAYMAPEQVLGESVDARADLYSLGATIYEALSGRAPFEGESIKGLFDAILAGRYTRLPARDPAAGPDIAQVVHRALEVDPAKRFGSAREMLAALAPWLPSARASAPPPVISKAAETIGADTIDARRRGLFRNGGIALLAGALIALSVTAFVVHRRQSKKGMSAASSASVASSSVVAVVPTAITDLAPPSSSSVEAVSAYREASQALRDGAVSAAIERTRAAKALDPSMPAARLRLALAFGWIPPVEARAELSGAMEHRARLSERDQALLDATEPFLLRDPPDLVEWERRLDAAFEKYPGDAELGMRLAIAHVARGDFAATAAVAERVLLLDPSFAWAWWLKADAAAYRGDFSGAKQSLDECLRIAPMAGRCRIARIRIAEEQGECQAMLTEARSMVAANAAGADGYLQVARALAALGKPPESVDEVLRQHVARLPESERETAELKNGARLAALMGDFAGAERKLLALRQRLGESPDLGEHGAVARFLADLYLEEKKPAQAARAAESFLKRRESWMPPPYAEDFALDDDASLRLLAAQVRAGALPRADFETRRLAFLRTWSEKLPGEYKRWLWVHGFAMTTETKADALAALDARREALPLPLPPFHAITLGDAHVGRVYFLAGRNDEALPFLERGARNCRVLELPLESTRAALVYGEALEAKGDKNGACDEYGRVIERWGASKQRPITLERARTRSTALGCRR